MTEGTTATVTADDLGLCPTDGLSVNEFDSGIWLRLKSSKLVSILDTHCQQQLHMHCYLQWIRTWVSIIVCSKRGPTMAFSRGCWLAAQVVARLGACMLRMRSPTSGAS